MARDDRFTPIPLDTLRLIAFLFVAFIPWAAAIAVGMLVAWLFEVGVCS